MENNRGFKGIWIPAEIWLDGGLTIQEKVFLAEIDSLDNDKGCFASNGYFSKFFELTKGRCSQIITSLEKKEYIKCTYIYREGTMEIDKRIIRVETKYFERGSYNPKGGSYNPKGGYLENAQGTNTVLNNTVNKSVAKKKPPAKKPTKQTFQEFVELTTEEHERLLTDYGQAVVDEYITRLNDYIGQSGKKYKSHNYTVRNWMNKDNIKPGNPMELKGDGVESEANKMHRKKQEEEFNELDKYL